MSEYWSPEILLAAAIGAGIGGSMLALFVRGSARTLADTGYLVLVAMLSIYIGAELVTGDRASFAIETAVASFVVVATRLAMMRWLPAIGIAIFLHGIDDAMLGPYTGVADWYPPLCAGFDLIVGAGLLMILHRRGSEARSGVLTQ